MRFGSVCSGIEAASVAWNSLGWEAAWVSEIEPFAVAALSYRHPYVQNYGDMTLLPLKVAFGDVEAPDVLVGGTPCQSFSIAGLRSGLIDLRGQLTMTFVALANEIDNARKENGRKECIVVWENVPGVLSSRDNAFGCFLAALAGEDEPFPIANGKAWSKCGVVFGPKRTVAWRVLDAQYFGLAQRRRRVFVVASARTDFHPAQVLFEFNGVRRDSPPSRKERQGTAEGIRNCALKEGRREGRSLTIPPALPDISMCLNAGGMGRLDAESETFIPTVAHSLRAEGFDASEDGTGRGVPIIATTNLNGDDCFPCLDSSVVIAFTSKDYAGDASEDLTPTLRAMNHDRSHANGGGQIAVAFHHNAQAMQLHTSLRDTSIADSLTCSQGSAVATFSAVRRLTPRECERLQGFRDDYTLIPWRGKPASDCPDGPRYKALGNSMAVPVMRFIGKRIEYGLANAWKVKQDEEL